jgi:tetratricopeptide (TPR) repeat protein
VKHLLTISVCLLITLLWANQVDELLAQARIARASGSYLNAERCYQDAERIARQAGDVTSTATVLFRLGGLYDRMGRYSQSVERYGEAALVFRQAGLLGDMLRADFNRAGVYLTIGRYGEARDILQRQLNLARNENMLGLTIRCLGNLGALELRTGNYRASQDAFNKALEILPTNSQLLLRAGLYSNLGVLAMRQRQTEEAQRYFDRALRIRQESGAAEEVARTRINLAEVLREAGDATAAYKMATSAVDSLRDQSYPSSLSSALKELSRCCAALDRYDEAEKHIVKCLQLDETSGDRRGAAMCNLILGRQRLGNGDTSRALVSLESAAASFKSVGERYPLYQSYFLIGRAQAKLNRQSEAEASLREALRMLESITSRLSVKGEAEKRFRVDHGDAYSELASLLIAQNRGEEALAVVDRARAFSVRNLLLGEGVSSASGGGDRETERRMVAELAALEARIATIKCSTGEAGSSELLAILEQDYSNSQQKYRAFVSQLLERNPSLAAMIQISPADLRRKQRWLDGETAIVQYLTTTEAVYLFVVTRDELRVRYAKVKNVSVRSKVEHYLALVESARNMPPRENWRGGELPPHIARLMLEIEKSSADLYSILITPMAADLKGIKTLSLFPHGVLHRLPFAALGHEENNRFVCISDTYRTFTLCSEVLMDLSKRQVEGKGGDRKILALGNADLSLPSAEEEVKAIAALYPGTRLALRKEAKESLVKKEGPGFDVLHFATHATVDAVEPNRSHIVLAGSDSEGEDGRLTCEEVSGMDLSRVRMVVLSACRTAVGRGGVRDEIYSLHYEFIWAGAGVVVASLWPVEDNSTAILMNEFYKNLKTESASESLRRAQCKLRESPRYNHPFYWAPFILIGDGR